MKTWIFLSLRAYHSQQTDLTLKVHSYALTKNQKKAKAAILGSDEVL